MRRAAKRDANEPAIREALEAAGYTVFPVSDDGIPDLLVTRPGKGYLLLEVKVPGKPLTKAQERFFHLSEGTARYMVTTAQDALQAAEYWLGGTPDV